MKWVFSLRGPWWAEATPSIRINGRWYWSTVESLLQDMAIELGVEEE